MQAGPSGDVPLCVSSLLLLSRRLCSGSGWLSAGSPLCPVCVVSLTSLCPGLPTGPPGGSLLRRTQKGHTVPSATLCGPEQVTRPAQIQGEKKQILFVEERGCKHYLTKGHGYQGIRRNRGHFCDLPQGLKFSSPA